VFFNGGDAFHEGSLTDPSHGCVHLSRGAAATFYDSLKPGDVVQVVR
jgi:lipoprotein-anchoring transpeptidase ErfK/SrfK